MYPRYPAGLMDTILSVPDSAPHISPVFAQNDTSTLQDASQQQLPQHQQQSDQQQSDQDMQKQQQKNIDKTCNKNNKIHSQMLHGQTL